MAAGPPEARKSVRTRSESGPPPWPALRNYNDADLKAIYAHLKTVTPIRNRVFDLVSSVEMGKVK